MAFFYEGVEYLTKTLTGGVCPTNPALQQFVISMRTLYYNQPETDKCLSELLKPAYLLVSPDKSERLQMSDWRFNPSLVAPVLRSLASVRTSATRMECIQSIELLLQTATGIERDAIGQKYPQESVQIVTDIKKFKAYDELMMPVRMALYSLAQSNLNSYRICIESEAFVAADATMQDNCTAAAVVALMTDRKLKHDIPAMDYGPFVIDFKRFGTVRTNNVYFPLVLGILENILFSISVGSTDVDELTSQMDIAKQWAASMSTSIQLPVEVDLSFFIRRTELFLHALTRKMSLSSFIRSANAGIVLSDQNTIYQLAAAVIVKHKLEEARQESRLSVREDIMRSARKLTSFLSHADLQFGRTAAAFVDRQFLPTDDKQDAKKAKFDQKVPISTEDVIMTLEQFYLV